MIWKGKLYGFRREDGRVGIRNSVAVMAAADDVNPLVRRLAEDVPGVVYLPASCGSRQLGEDLELTLRAMAGLAGHPNVSGCLIVSFEPESALRISERVAGGGRKAEVLSLLHAGGFTAARMAGQGILFRLWEEAKEQKREPFSPEDLLIGLACGDSDPSSGMIANPALGLLSDRLVDAGAAAIFSEPLECIGCEPGEEKSRGAVSKSGTQPIRRVLAYGERPVGKGLYFMNAPAAAVENLTALAAAGCQAILFTTGSVSPVGHPVSPTVKICASPSSVQRMFEHVDVDLSRTSKGKLNPTSCRKRIEESLLGVINGDPVAAERLGYLETNISRIGQSV